MLAVNFLPFPVLQTGRLHLTQLGKEDEAGMFALRSDKEVMQHIPRPLASSLHDAALVIDQINEGIKNNNSITWGMHFINDPALIGTIGFVRMTKEYFRAEVGYLLAKHLHGQGIMTEALVAVLDYGFNRLGLHSVEAVVGPENKSSIRLLEKNKFRREGYFRQNQFYHQAFQDTVYYSILKADFIS